MNNEPEQQPWLTWNKIYWLAVLGVLALGSVIYWQIYLNQPFLKNH